uniref:Sulfotransferase domain-containing protein n=1 Tax=Corethron hystrix TaxID=216773 RepID=A0A7S1B5F2_9STRA|mmetsp:Transcript_13627/g.30051  ORF Transcript_13627/g.30051 Transcript_13627/m.30051 type:complete len:358 (+) Transcript_13627:92-1165(+)
MTGTTVCAITVALLSVAMMVLSPYERYLLKCWAFYPIYKFVIGGFHKFDQNINGYFYLNPLVNPPERIAAARAYEPDSDDLFFTAYPKSGTHALGFMMVHLLSGGKQCTTGCDLREFVTAAEFAADHGMDLDDARDAYATVPRLIGTHMPAHHMRVVGSEARYLVIVRDPVAVLQSLRTMHFFLFGPVLRQSLDEFVALHTDGSERDTGWADHVHGWWRLRALPNVRIIFYEDLVAEPEQTVRTVAEFVGRELDAGLLDIVTERMSKDWTIRHCDVTTEASTPFSPPAAFRKEIGSASTFIVNSTKFFSVKGADRFSLAQESIIRSSAWAKMLALDAGGGTDGADFIKNRPYYFKNP